MYWRKSCACCSNWKSSLHGSRWLIFIKLLKIIEYKPTELSIYRGRLKSKKQPAQPIFLAEPLISTAAPSSLPVGESQREGNKPQGLYLGDLGVGKDCCNSGNALSPPLPHGGGSGLQQIQALQAVWKRMPETSTAGIFQVVFIARLMEQTLQAFFQTTFEPIGRVCTARNARGGLGLQGKWRTRACVPSYIRATSCVTLNQGVSNV